MGNDKLLGKLLGNEHDLKNDLEPNLFILVLVLSKLYDKYDIFKSDETLYLYLLFIDYFELENDDIYLFIENFKESFDSVEDTKNINKDIVVDIIQKVILNSTDEVFKYQDRYKYQNRVELLKYVIQFLII